MWPNHKLNDFDIGLEGFLTINIDFNFFLQSVLQYFEFIQNIGSPNHVLF